MNVNIVTLPKQRVAALRHIGSYLDISSTFSKLGVLCQQAQLLGPHSAMVAVFYDDPETTPQAELESDAGIIVSSHAVIPVSLTELELQAGNYAVALHVGPYAELPATWSRYKHHWLPQSGYCMGAGVPFEKYLNTPMDVPETELRTELYLPVAAAK